jgi:hypothetical protein
MPAFDIAGTGCADEGSLLEAIRQAVELAHPRSLLEKYEMSGWLGLRDKVRRHWRGKRHRPRDRARTSHWIGSLTAARGLLMK